MADDSERGFKPALGAVYLTAVAAIIAAAMPFTAYINGRYSVQVEREKFISQMRLSYLDRALDTSRDVFYRESVLKFLLETTDPSDPLYKWAKSQLQNADEIRRLQGEILKADAGIESIKVELAKERSQRTRDNSVASARERELLRKITAALEDRTRLEKALSNAEVKAGRPVATQATSKASRADSEGAASLQDAPKPKIGSAVAEVDGPVGSARLIIRGRNFGSKAGHLYIVNNYVGGSQSFRLLEILSWSDTWIESSITVDPVNLRRQLAGDGPEISIGLTTADTRFSDQVPVSVQMGRSY